MASDERPEPNHDETGKSLTGGRAEPAAQFAGSKSEREGEHDGEAQDEERDRRETSFRLAARHTAAREEREIAGHERQHARRRICPCTPNSVISLTLSSACHKWGCSRTVSERDGRQVSEEGRQWRSGSM